MTRLTIDAQGMVTLGGRLLETADLLDVLARPSATHGLGSLGSHLAYGELVRNWTHERILLGNALRELGAAAATAGATFVEVEAGITVGLEPGHTGER